MRISYNWLREYVDVKNSARMVAQWLTMTGLEVKSVEEKGKDSILEIEITSNRPDWLSLIGVAREVSALTGKHLNVPKVPALLPVFTREKQIKVEIEDKPLCPRYTARIIDGVNVGLSPEWLKARLEAIGIRSVNNVVDITNFCLFELGQPMHAFDYDKLESQAIIVRRAKRGETLIMIDGIKRELDNDMLIVADGQRPIAVAGVMGGKDTEVNENTKAILLESAYFDPISVRKTQRKLALSTESSYRFERGVDFEGVPFGSNRAARMIVEICGGKTGILKDAGVKVAKTSIIKLSVAKTNRILNLSLAPIEVKKILTGLGLKVIGAQEELRVQIPSFRGDLKIEEDLIEEVSRIYGYEKIPITIPKMVGHSERKSFLRNAEEKTRDFLVGEGLNEVITYSLMDRKDLANINFPDQDKVVFIENPLNSQQEIMRPTIIPGILRAAVFNINRKMENLGMFELSKVYSKPGGMDKGYKEELSLCILMSGEINSGWRQKSKVDFFEIKGAVENLFDKLGINDYQFVADETGVFSPARCAKILVKNDEVGVIGEAKREVLDNFDIKKEIFLCEIKFEKLIKFVSMEKRVFALPKFLPTTRDISVIADNSVYIKDLLEVIKKEGGEILKDAKVSDEYFGAQIPSGKRGLTLSIEYLSSDKQLTEEEIEGVHSRIKGLLVKQFAVGIR
jgi:phenylalanyl-tRNA synthetase beta chain